MLAVCIAPAIARGVPGVGLPALLSQISLADDLASYPTLQPGGTQGTPASWRVISDASGNPYENYVMTTPSGRILNWGGTYLRYTDDAGLSWSEVRPRVALLSAEGTLVGTPDGGVVGATWSPYTADRVVTIRYSPTDGWRWLDTVMHTPFFDRPWVGVIPGPYTIAGQQVPFVTVLAGGWPVKPRFYSLDGLTYLAPTNEQTAIATPVALPEMTPDASVDWTAAHTNAALAPLPGGGALSTGQVGCRWALSQPDLRWGCVQGPVMPQGSLHVDSAARMHVVDISFSGQILYNLSTDAGQTWTVWFGEVPNDGQVEAWDVRAHGGLGLAAIALHAHDPIANTDQDLVLKFSTGTGAPVLERTYFLGDGDYNFAGSLNAQGSDRFDFTSVAFLPSGKLVTSFGDSDHIAAALAIEL